MTVNMVEKGPKQASKMGSNPRMMPKRSVSSPMIRIDPKVVLFDDAVQAEGEENGGKATALLDPGCRQSRGRWTRLPPLMHHCDHKFGTACNQRKWAWAEKDL